MSTTPPPPRSSTAASSFRFHSALEPITVDPAGLSESTGGFLFYNLYRSLYRYTGQGALVPELATKCVWINKLHLQCFLKKQIMFSNGQPITSKEVIQSWQRLVDPHTGSRHAELLIQVKGAKEILQGQKPPSSLQALASGPEEINIFFAQPDPEFLYKLASPTLSPVRESLPTASQDFAQTLTTGPYRIKSWQKKNKIELENNPFYFAKRPRPDVEVLLVDEDMTALNLYDLNKLTLLRRLPVKEIPLRKNRPGFSFFPTLRFDYIGFGPQLKDQKNLRKALSLALQYDELTALYLTPGVIGCPSLPTRMSKPWPCLKFNLAQAKKAFNLVPQEWRQRKLKFVYSKAGGEDILRGMEWMQAQWKKHLGLQVELQAMEPTTYLHELHVHPPDLFRKGVNLDRPTCTAALELFVSPSPENYIQLQSDQYDQLVEKVAQSFSATKKKALCGQGLSFLLNEFYLIPLGELYFARMAHPAFTGWQISPLNQLDLTELRRGD